MNLLRTFAVGMALLALAATPASAQSGGDLERITLQLRWEYEFQFAGFVAARELGYYREVGLDVELRELHFGMSVYEELRSGRAQYAVGTTDAVVERASGTPVVALAAIFQHSPFVIISREDAGIRAPEDLVGRRVSTYDTRNTILEAMLHSEGVDAARVDFVPYDQDYARIASGEVSATTAVITLQPYAFEQMGIPFSIMYPRTYGIDFYGNTLITLEDEVRRHPDRVRAFREASLRGWEYALANPGEIIDIYLEKYSPQVERGLLEFEAAAIRDLMQPELIAVGHMNPGRWRQIANEYRNLGIIDGPFSLDGFLYEPNPVQDNAALLRLVALFAGLTVLVGAAAATLFTLNSRLRRARDERQQKVTELESALSEIRVLQELLPICSACKKIRDDDGFWQNVETYISRHTSTVFSHGMCPECMGRWYPDLLADDAAEEALPPGS